MTDNTQGGMNRSTGHAMDARAHIRQSIADILQTPIGTRVKRRAYGSLIPELIDQPLDDALTLQLYAATVMALAAWEPRVQVDTVALTRSGARLTLDLALIRFDGSTDSFSHVLAG